MLLVLITQLLTASVTVTVPDSIFLNLCFNAIIIIQCCLFVSSGSVMYQNTPENPMVSVSRLCHKHSRDESVLLGEYTHTGSKVRKRSPPLSGV